MTLQEAFQKAFQARRRALTLLLMSYDDLRTGRYSSPGQLYMVTTVTAGRQPFFIDFTLARRVITEMRHSHSTGKVNSLAWVLMPDHLHWLFQLGDAGTLAEAMQSFKGRSHGPFTGLTSASAPFGNAATTDHALRSEDDVRGVGALFGRQSTAGRLGSPGWRLFALGRGLGVVNWL